MAYAAPSVIVLHTEPPGGDGSCGTRSMARAPSTPRYDAALITKTGPSPDSPMRAPPMAGPTRRAALNIDELSAIALGR